MTTYAEMTADQLEERGFNALRLDGAAASAFFLAAEVKRKAQERALATYDTSTHTYYSTTVNNPVAESVGKRVTRVASLGLLGETAQASLREKARDQENNSRGLTYPAEYASGGPESPSEAPEKPSWDYVYRRSVQALGRAQGDQYEQVREVIRALNRLGLLDYNDIA